MMEVLTVLGAIGSGAPIAAVPLIALSFASGHFLAGRNPCVRTVMVLGTAQRNVSAAMVVAAQNFNDSVNPKAFLSPGRLTAIGGELALVE